MISARFAVVGVWESDAELAEKRAAALDGLVAGIRELPGFEAGYWTTAIDEPNRSHTFIVFSDRAAAASFAEGVRGNAAGQSRAGIRQVSLVVVEVQAHASAPPPAPES